MKRLVSAISVLTIAASILAPAGFAADTDTEMKSVLESVKARVEIPEECSEFSSGTNTMYGATKYRFNWCSKDDEERKYVNIECYDNGVITSYCYADDSSYSNEPKLPKISKDDAKKIAEDFVEALNPDFPYEIRVEDNENGNLYSSGYSFDTEVYINGVSVYQSVGSVSVDGENGSVENCYINYAPTEYPSVENAISKEDAKKAYSEKLGLKLVYRTYVDDDGNEIAYPVYVQKYDYNHYINAFTGEIEDFSKNIGGLKKENFALAEKSAASDSGSSAGRGLTEQEIEELDNVSGLVSKADMENMLKNNETLDIPKTAKVTNINLSKQYNKEVYAYTISMSDDKTNIYLSADAKTGEIKRYNRYSENSNKERNFKNENDDTLAALAGDKASEYKYDEDGGYYKRYVNGICVEGDNAYITYEDDVLTNYSIGYTNTVFPSIDGVMSVSDAEKAMFDKDGYEIQYEIKYTNEAMTAIPVYVHNTVSINPFSGKYVNYQNEEVTNNDNVIEYSDISGHYAEKYIRELAYYRVGFEGGEFKADEKITQKDFLILLSSVYQGNAIVLKDNAEQADYIYRNAVKKNIVPADERDDGAAVTRENAAIYMIRAMGAEEYAKYNDIYVSPFKDVTENKGYITLLSAMGVVSGDDENFAPKREITRAESVIMIYNYLTR